MALTDGDKAECMLIAQIIIKEVLDDHIKSCPHHQAYLVGRAKIFGVICGIIVASGVTSGTMTAIIMKIIF